MVAISKVLLFTSAVTASVLPRAEKVTFADVVYYLTNAKAFTDTLTDALQEFIRTNSTDAQNRQADAWLKVPGEVDTAATQLHYLKNVNTTHAHSLNAFIGGNFTRAVRANLDAYVASKPLWDSRQEDYYAHEELIDLTYSNYDLTSELVSKIPPGPAKTRAAQVSSTLSALYASVSAVYNFTSNDI